MSDNKTKPTTASVDEFVSNIENSRRRRDTLTALELYMDITGQEAVMWGPSIIGFGLREYEYKSGRAGIAPLACFSPRKANMTFYVGDSFEGALALYSKLGKYKKSVACLYINKLDDVDLTVLREIIKRQMLKKMT